MSEIVAAFGVPHSRDFPQHAAREGPRSTTARRFAGVRKHLDAADPDILVVFVSGDSERTAFAVGCGTRCVGPSDHGDMPRYEVRLDDELARSIGRAGAAAGVDISLVEAPQLDHTIVIALAFLTPRMHLPIVPVFIPRRAFGFPTARQCFSLGAIVAGAVAGASGGARVAIGATGSICRDIDELRAGTSGGMDAAASSAAGDYLNWIALLGATGVRRPQFIEFDAGEGHAYAAWRSSASGSVAELQPAS